MKNTDKLMNLFSTLASIAFIIAGLIGIFYTTGGESYIAANVYGDKVTLYGDGVYAYNSLLTVSARLGSDLLNIFSGVVVLILTFLRRKNIITEYIRASFLIYFAYNAICLVFGLSMNQLYLLYVLCLGLSLYAAIFGVRKVISETDYSGFLEGKPEKGLGIFLILSGSFTALLWLSLIIPAITNSSYTGIIGAQSTEPTYTIDFILSCPILILSGIGLIKKKKFGYQCAPFLLILLILIAVLVIIQRLYCYQLGVEVPLPQLISMIVSFVILGIIAFLFAFRFMKKLKQKV